MLRLELRVSGAHRAQDVHDHLLHHFPVVGFEFVEPVQNFRV